MEGNNNPMKKLPYNPQIIEGSSRKDCSFISIHILYHALILKFQLSHTQTVNDMILLI